MRKRSNKSYIIMENPTKRGARKGSTMSGRSNGIDHRALTVIVLAAFVLMGFTFWQTDDWLTSILVFAGGVTICMLVVMTDMLKFLGGKSIDLGATFVRAMGKTWITHIQAERDMHRQTELTERLRIAAEARVMLAKLNGENAVIRNASSANLRRITNESRALRRLPDPDELPEYNPRFDDTIEIEADDWR